MVKGIMEKPRPVPLMNKIAAFVDSKYEYTLCSNSGLPTAISYTRKNGFGIRLPKEHVESIWSYRDRLHIADFHYDGRRYTMTVYQYKPYWTNKIKRLCEEIEAQFSIKITLKVSTESAREHIMHT